MSWSIFSTVKPHASHIEQTSPPVGAVGIQVAGYKTWQSLKRQVRKVEHGIMIFAPCPWKKEEVTDAGETETREWIFFRAGHVFDVSKTDGPDLPEVDVPTINAMDDELLADLTCLRVPSSSLLRAAGFREFHGQF